MPRFLNSKSLYYDDVNLIAQPNCFLKSRKDVPRELWRIMVSPMPAIVGPLFAKRAYELGLTVFLPRFYTKEKQLKMFQFVKDTDLTRLICAIGLNDWERYEFLYDGGVRAFCIDLANAYLETVVDFTQTLKNLTSKTPSMLVVGNVHSAAGVRLYRHLGPSLLLRCGIGNGSSCETSSRATGYGRGQITELKECLAAAEGLGVVPFADGGIKNGACAAKAFGLGSQYVMLGGYFCAAEESQNVIDREYKFWGCASDYNQQKFGEKRNHSEGKVMDVDKDEIKPLSFLVDELWGGISSAVSYGGYQRLSDFIGNGVFEIKG